MSDTDTDADASSSSSPLYTPTSSLYSSFTTHDIPPSPRISLDASRPDSPGSDDPWGSSSETDSTDSDAEEEWRESLRQLEMFAGLVLMPLVGKFLGRRCAYWVWARFMTWKFPGKEVVVTSRKVFEGVGLVETAAMGVKEMSR